MYICYSMAEKFQQISFEDIINGTARVPYLPTFTGGSNTKTICTRGATDRLRNLFDVQKNIDRLREFVQRNSYFIQDDMSGFYRHTQIPKKGGDGWRPIDIPCKELSDAQRELQAILKSMMLADHHNAAHAYIEKRSTYTANEVHTKGHMYTIYVKNEQGDSVATHAIYPNNFAAEFDFHGFFPSSTFEFVTNMFSVVYPFALIWEKQEGKDVLTQALKICFLNNGLPQGTPISPWISNVMMIPFDHILSKSLRKRQMNNGQELQFTYTRYADDIKISCYKSFDYREIESLIKSVLTQVGATFTLNEAKTRYGNRNSSSSWWLGLEKLEEV